MRDILDRREVPLHDQIKCAEREVKMRERIYPRWVSVEKMTSEATAREIAAMKAILETLREVEAIGHTAAASSHGA